MLKELVRKMVVGYRIVNTPQRLPVAYPITAQINTQVSPTTIPIRFEPIIQPIVIPTTMGQPTGQSMGITPLEFQRQQKEKEVEGFEIPSFLPAEARIGKVMKEEVEQQKISLVYPLIPKKPAKNEPIFAYAKISWDSEVNRYFYQLVEPEISGKLKDLLKKIKDLLEEKLDIDFSKLKRMEAVGYLHKNVDELLQYFNLKVGEEEKKVLHYYIERDFIGLGNIEALMNDDGIEDISCDGTGIPIFVFHRDPTLGSLVTNVSFDDADELDSFIRKISQICGKSISVTSPLAEGSLPDGSRLQATLATDIARRGSNFTIRKFTEEPLTPIHLLIYRTLNVQILAYLWLAVDYGRNILVSGGTASGKTSLLNVLSLFIRPEKKIVSIEDTPELKLPHPHWIPTVARTVVAEEGRKMGEVDLFDLLKESLRQRPDYIVVGEVRGKEAFVLFQEMATGHPSLSTIHAENMPRLIDRLTTAPIALPAGLVESLDVVVFLLRVRYKDKNVRRVNEVIEMVGIDTQTKTPITNLVFKWNPINDNFEIVGKSVLLKKISEMTGLNEQQLKDELERRMFVLNWMKERNIVNYKDVFTVMNMYYTYPERVLSSIKGEI
jgi:flagellar protein FlaI